jgi:hypothetical protein
MGEVVDANRMATTPYQLNFRTDRKDQVICEKTLSDDDMAKFRKVSATVYLSLKQCGPASIAAVAVGRCASGSYCGG